jgi:hypothetical protein
MELPPRTPAGGLATTAGLDHVAAADQGAALIKDLLDVTGALLFGFPEGLAEAGGLGGIGHGRLSDMPIILIA